MQAAGERYWRSSVYQPVGGIPVEVDWGAIGGVRDAGLSGSSRAGSPCGASCQPAFRAASSMAASMLPKFVLSILSITGPVSRPIGPPLGTYR